jgi:glucose/arabinose dehydrogenase
MRKHITRRRIETALAGILAVVAAGIGISSRDEGRIGPKFLVLDKIGRFKEPVHLAQPRGADELYVVEKAGRVMVLDRNGDKRRQPYLDLRKQVKDDGKGGEQGLLSIAFAPDYPDSRLSYVAYTDHRNALRVVEYRPRPGDDLVADPRSARLVLRIPQPTTKHHGGLLLFGLDKYLYIGSGDGGPSGDPNDVAQSKRELLGKLLRIDPRTRPVAPPKTKKGRKNEKPTGYTVPRDNPYVGRPGRDEIFAYGLRNPWRFSFDRATGNLTIGDVGNYRYEEIDILPSRKALGANFGWSAYEANYRFKRGVVPRNRTVPPVLAYPHGPGCAVTGGYVVRDPRLSRIAGREVVGRYIFGDFCTGRLFAFRYKPKGQGGRERSFKFRVPALSSFAEDRGGRIYLIQQFGPPRKGRNKSTRGAIYRLETDRKRIDD